MVMKKKITIMIPTVIDCAIMKCEGCENRTKPNMNKPNKMKPNLTRPSKI